MTEPRSDQTGSDKPVGMAAQSVKEQATQVMGEVREQTRGVAHDIRDRVSDEARTQNDRLAEGLRQMAQELQRMASDRPDTPARSVVARIAQGGEQAADYLSKHGPDGVLTEIQDFARRRPGAFLATALVSGFVVGRLGKAVITATTAPDTTHAQDTAHLPQDRYPDATPAAATVAMPAPAATPAQTQRMYQPGQASVPEVPS